MPLPLLLMAITQLPAGAADYIAGTLHLTHYRAAAADLNGDGAPEVLAYAEGPENCGSGGCDLYVVSRTSSGWQVITQLSVTRPPIRLLPTRTNGWHDLGVYVAGGGILPGHDVRLRFDGRRYPDNPCLFPARPAGAAPGSVLLP